MNELTREEVKAVVERRGLKRVPMHRMDYLTTGVIKRYGKETLQELHSRYPDDIVPFWYPWPDWDSLTRNNLRDASPIDSRIIIEDYSDIDGIVEKIGELSKTVDFTGADTLRTENPERYCMGYTWYGIWHRLWMLRGMENAFVDFYENPDETKKLLRAICDFHLAAIHHYGKLGYDAVMTSDDLGGQNTTLFSKAIFDEFFRPLYNELFACAHSYGMHMWMHSCGHVIPLIDDLIEAGLDVLHPIQHSTYPGTVSANDIAEVTKRFKGRITFWAGIDVQYLMPLGTPDEVRKGVRELIDTFSSADGGMIIGAGNAIMTETPYENIEVFYDEAYKYGNKE